MARRPTVDLFCEDAGHEAFTFALLSRLARELSVPRPTLNARSARGGHGAAIRELKLWQRTLRRGAPTADLLVVVIDANGEGWAGQRKSVAEAIDGKLFPDAAVLCPDPHVEAWIAADPGAFRRAFCVEPPQPPGRPGRDAYKAWLGQALELAEISVMTDPMEVSAEIVPEIDLYAAQKASQSFRGAVAELTAFLRRFGVPD